MPRIARFRSTEIAMYFADHPPPHFHVLGRDGQAQVAIEDFRVIARSGRVDLHEALAWAAEHREELVAQWEELSGGG
ncbi:MAG TPA: DUF4160 domain-containing protein [Hyphomonadaceae bacterium]|jgi:hypothetical protein|nr:DUF4160 domain-containing protein [Hyphomonadaceae bacterium]